MLKCPFCNRKINKNDGIHIYKCKKLNLIDKNDIKFKYVNYNFPYISNKNNLYNEYFINLKSFTDIRYEYGISYRNIDFLLNYYNIKKRDKKTSSKLISIKKYKKTCISKYGTDNVSKLNNVNFKKNINYKNSKLKEKLNNNKILYEWIKNEYQFGNIYNIYKNNNKDFIKNEYIKLINNYYKYWTNLNDDEKNNLLNEKFIPLESFICEILNKMNISYITNFSIGKNIFDIKIINSNILLEINSDFWHANPLLYNKTDILKFPFKKEKVMNIWNKDNKKNKIGENMGYKIIYIWENDLKNINHYDKLNFLINILKNYL